MSKSHKTLIKAFTTLTDYVERTIHWRKGGADRHDAKLALKDVGEVLDDIEWTEKGLVEWRDQALASIRQAEAARATARIAITHLQEVLNKAQTFDEQIDADTAARDWLISIGSEPT